MFVVDVFPSVKIISPVVVEVFVRDNVTPDVLFLVILTLFKNDDVDDTDKVEDICNNYLQGLEWVFRYYTDDCYDWNWKYNYNYPPLLVDMGSTTTKTKYFLKCMFNPVDAKTQLDYVLPEGKNIKDLKFKWTFCRYLWEGHIEK